MAKDDDMISDEAWEQLIADDIAEESQRREDRNLADRIASGIAEEPGAGDYDAYPQTEDDQAFNNFMMKSASDDDCQWVTMRGTPVCIGDDENIEIGPDGIDAPIKDDISQDDDIFHNIKTDPTKADREDFVQYVKDVASFKLRKDSLLSQAIKKLTTDPTVEDRGRVVEMIGDVLTLKPVRNFKLKENPAGDDLAIIYGGAKKVIGGTAGGAAAVVGFTVKTLWKSLKLGYRVSQKAASLIPRKKVAKSLPMSFKAFDAANAELTEEMVIDEVIRRAGKELKPADVHAAIESVFEEILQSLNQ